MKNNNSLRTGKAGLLDVKLGSRNYIRNSWKSWKKKWVVVHGMLDLVTGQVLAKLTCYPEDVGRMKSDSEDSFDSLEMEQGLSEANVDRSCTILVENIVKIKRTVSRSQRYSFGLYNRSNRLVLSLAGSSETTSQNWMSTFRCIFHHQESSIELERVFSGLKEISVLRNTSNDANLNDRFAFLSIKSDSMCLLDPTTSEIMVEWRFRIIKRFMIIPQPNPEDDGKVLRIEVNSKSESYEVDMFCEEAQQVLDVIEKRIQDLVKRQKRVESNTDLQFEECYYDVPKTCYELSASGDDDDPSAKHCRDRHVSVRLQEESVYDVPKQAAKDQDDETKSAESVRRANTSSSSVNSDESRKSLSSVDGMMEFTCSTSDHDNSSIDTRNGGGSWRALSFLENSFDDCDSGKSENQRDGDESTTTKQTIVVKDSAVSEQGDKESEILDSKNRLESSNDRVRGDSTSASDCKILYPRLEDVRRCKVKRKSIDDGTVSVVDGSAAEQENIYEELNKFMRKDINKFLGLTTIDDGTNGTNCDDQIISPPLPPRRYTKEASICLDLEDGGGDANISEFQPFLHHRAPVKNDIRSSAMAESSSNNSSSSSVAKSPSILPKIGKGSLMRILSGKDQADCSPPDSPQSLRILNGSGGNSRSLYSFSGRSMSSDELMALRPRDKRSGSDPCCKRRTRTLSFADNATSPQTSRRDPISSKLSILEETTSLSSSSSLSQRQHNRFQRNHATLPIMKGQLNKFDRNSVGRQSLKRPGVRKQSSLPTIKFDQSADDDDSRTKSQSDDRSRLPLIPFPCGPELSKETDDLSDPKSDVSTTTSAIDDDEESLYMAMAPLLFPESAANQKLTQTEKCGAERFVGGGDESANTSDDSPQTKMELFEETTTTTLLFGRDTDEDVYVQMDGFQSV